MLGRGPIGAVVAIAVSVAALSLPAAAGAARSPLAGVSIVTGAQPDLLSAQSIPLHFRARRSVRVRVSARLWRGRQGVVVTRAKRVRLLPGRRAVALRLSPQGLRAIADCRPGRMVVTVTVTGSRTRRRAVRALAPQPPACSRFFGSRSFWNTPLGGDAELDPNSASITGDLFRQLEQNYRSGRLPTVNTTSYSAPVYTVPYWQPAVRVRLDQPAGLAPDLERTFASVPIPVGARPAQGTDGSMVVWQPSTNRLWEFWQARVAPDGWHARWGGGLVDVDTGSGRFEAPTANWGATATSLPLAGGLITPDELRRGRIDHALAMAIPEPKAGVFARPAQRTDGTSRRAEAVPEGARFRLDPGIDLATLGLPRTVRILAEAAQRYGIIVRDRGEVVALYAQDPVNLPANPYPALFGPAGAGEMLRSFPWWGLRLTRMDLVHDQAPGWNPCLILCP